MSESPIPNPFDSARRVDGVTVRLRPEDLIAAYPDGTVESVQRMFDCHGGTIAAIMLQAGIEAGIDLMRREGGVE
jgi:hypothetical protein